MRPLFFLTSVFVAIVAALSSASALDVVVEKTKIKLAAPDGYCALDASHPLDSQVMDVMQKAVQSRNEQLGVYASCDRLSAWHEGKAVDLGDLADYQANLKLKAQNFKSNKVVTGVCETLRQQGVALTKRTEKEIAKNYEAIKQFAGKIKFNTQQLYGILHEDETGCYAGLVQKAQVGEKVETGFTVLAVTLVKQKLVYFYVHSGGAQPTTMDRLLKKSQATVKALLAQN